MIDELFGGWFAPRYPHISAFPGAAPQGYGHANWPPDNVRARMDYEMLRDARSVSLPPEPRWRSIDPKRQMTDKQARVFVAAGLLSRA